ncbi:MAG: hypothetical protein ACR2G0_11610 [Chthoniobacterales bacterium]
MKNLLSVSRWRLFTRFGFLLSSHLLVSISLANLDFSPQEAMSDMEGVNMRELTFNTGLGPKAIYQPPREWKYSGGKDYLDLQPGGVTQVRARVSRWPFSPNLSFDPEGCKQMTEQVINSLPDGSEQVKIREELNPLQICGKRTYLVELTYVYYGERFKCYTLLLDRKPEVLCFRLSCREANYETLREAFRRSLYSWQNL